MQRIERYGVIALVLLLVTILAVSLWGEGKQGLRSSDRVAQAAQKSGARAPDAPVSRTAPIESRGARDRALPTSQAPLGPSALPLEGFSDEASTALDSASPLNAAGEGRRGRRSFAPSAAEGLLGTAPPEPMAATATPTIEVLPPTVYVPPSTSVAPRRASEPRAIATASMVVVRSGETLSEIAQRELGSSKRWTEIAAFNGGLDPTKLRKGMVLKLPPRESAAAVRPIATATLARPLAPAAEPRPEAGAGTRAGSYVVRKGDVLTSIAQRELGTSKRWKEIVALNPGLDPGRLIIGARLTMPAATAAAAPAKSAPQSNATSASVQVAKATPSAPQGAWSAGRSGGKVR